MNVLFITADQWRGDTLSAMGHTCVRTPNLDRLAGDGVLFRRHFSQATPCAPGRASLYTGRYLMNHRVVANGVPLDRRHKTVATEARRAGLEPVLFGYSDAAADPRGHHPGDPALSRVDDVLPGMTPMVHMGDALYPWIADLQAKGYNIPAGEFGVFQTSAEACTASGRGRTFSPALYDTRDSATAYLADEVMKYISVHASRPWFVHLSLWAPHPPFVVSAPYHEMYHPSEVPPPIRADSVALESAQHPYLDYWLSHQKGTGIFLGHEASNNLKLTDTDVLQARATYYGMMSEVDFHLGRLLDFLSAGGHDQETLVVFTSDHGEQLGDHWQFAKYGYFDESFHVPLIVRDPSPESRPSRGRQVTQFTENVDVMPTILDRLGVRIPRTCDGATLTPFLSGDTPGRWRTEAHWEFDFRNAGASRAEPPLGLSRDECGVCVVRGERYKYVHFTGLPALLFDLENDPHEFTNLATHPDYRNQLVECTQLALDWRMRNADRELTDIELTPDGPKRHVTSDDD
jgi:arylsulfatase A-like enzyme